MLRRAFSNLAIGSTGAVLGALTDPTEPGYLLAPESNAAAGAFSLAVLAFTRRRRSLLIAGPHGLNAALQLYQLGRWGAAEPIQRAEGVPKTRIVVLGSGWGAATILKNLDAKLTGPDSWYDVTVVSPRNYFVFSPLLPGAVAGTVEVHSIIESTRSLMRGKGTYHEAEATAIDPAARTLTCRYNKPSRRGPEDHVFELPYDVLVVAVGAIQNDFNTPGVREHAYFLKEANHAQELRSRINECFELASLPGTTKDQRQKLLTFCVVGGGPTGVEAAAEMHDLVEEDLLQLFPHFKDEVAVKLIETRDHILGAFDRHISEFADQAFARQGIQVVYNSRVKSVEEDGVWLKFQDSDELQKLTAGTTVWCTGIKMNPLAETIAAAMPDGQQEHRHAIHVDSNLAVNGSGGRIFALGDAATVDQPHVLDHAEELFQRADLNGDGLLSCAEVRCLIRSARFEYPQLAEHARWFNCGDAADASSLVQQLEDAVSGSTSWWRSQGKKEQREAQTAVSAEQVAQEASGQSPSDGGITQRQFRAQLETIDKSLRALPATAQVANQQGRYLARLLNSHHVGAHMDAASPNGLPASLPKFKYRHLGSFAYIGADTAVLETNFQEGHKSIFKGLLCGLAWKGMETWMQLSLRTKWMVSRDWIRTKLFGRDISDA